MTRWQWLGSMAFVGAILLTPWLSSAIWAQQPRLEYPPPGPGSCVPDVMNFGHYERPWRRWPGEVRLEQINPHAPTSEILRTPQGREIVPPPKATAPQQPQAQQPQPPSTREENELPAGGLIRQPEGTLLPQTPGGSENKPGSTKPTAEGELPGLPSEPIPSKPSDVAPPAKPPAKTPANTPTKTPAKPPADKPPKSSMWNDGPKPEDSANVRVVWPAQSADIQSGRQEAWQKNNQPPAPAVGGTNADAVAALAGSMEPERNASLRGACRAEPIGVTADSSSAPVEPAAYAFAESPPKPAAVNRAAIPSIALGGYCPVELSGNGRWVLGDLRWTVVHRGWIYRLSGAEQRKQFLADPDRYAPANSGNDVVLSASENRSIPGQTTYCAIYNNHLYMFCSEASQAEFNRNPERYATKR